MVPTGGISGNRLLISKSPLLMLSHANFFRTTDTFSTTTYGLLQLDPTSTYLHLWILHVLNKTT